MSTTTFPPPNVEYIYITFWDKVAIVSGAAGFLLLVSCCMVCFLCPECLCHGLCFGKENENSIGSKKRKIGSQRSTTSRSSKGSYGSTDSDYYYGLPEGTESGPLKWTPLHMIRESDTDWSSDAPPSQEVIRLEECKTKPTTDLNGVPNGKLDDSFQTPLENGEIEFTLDYSPSEEKLFVKIFEVRDIVLSEGRELVSPYVKVRLYRNPKQFFTFIGGSMKDNIINNLDKEMKTKMQRPSDVLAYKETFEIPLSADALKNYTIRLLLCDMDKLSRHVILGETSESLKNLENSTETTFKEKLIAPVEENLGSITLGLSYLPTSEKMFLTMESITGLKVMDKNAGSTDACVKAYLMCDGKQLKRVKTTVRGMDLNPVFNESFSFDVPQVMVEKVYFSIIVSHYSMEKKGTKLIGRVYMGLNFEQGARNHWSSMIQNPRKKIVASYKILN